MREKLNSSIRKYAHDAWVMLKMMLLNNFNHVIKFWVVTFELVGMAEGRRRWRRWSSGAAGDGPRAGLAGSSVEALQVTL
jgi:hypothetical protein